MDIAGRFEQLLLLNDGWLEGQGKAPSAAGIAWLNDAFAQSYPEDLPTPFVYPTPEGGVTLEWSFDPHEISIDIDLESRHAHWHALDTEADTEEERDLNLDRSEEWAWLAERIRRTAGGAA